MIYSFKRGKTSILKHAKAVKALNRKIHFKPGVNVIVGSNGSGKSTLLTTLTTLFMAKQQGYTKINGMTDLGDLFMNSHKNEFLINDKIEHNGEPLLCIRKYSKSHFDDNNFIESFQSINAQNDLSTGEDNKYHFNALIHNMKKVKPVDSLVKEFKANCNSLYRERINNWYEWFKSGITNSDDKKYTIVLDEPTAGFDFNSKIDFWNIVKQNVKYQLLIATHDIIPLFINEFNKIELEKGYVNKVKEIVRELDMG